MEYRFNEQQNAPLSPYPKDSIGYDRWKKHEEAIEKQKNGLKDDMREYNWRDCRKFESARINRNIWDKLKELSERELPKPEDWKPPQNPKPPTLPYNPKGGG